MKKNIKSTLYEPSFLLMTTGTPTTLQKTENNNFNFP